jgi:mRNA interferase MazF
VILCQITSKTIRDIYSIALDDTDFRTGGLRQPSNVRPNRIFTADNSIILYRVGSLKTAKTEEIEDGVVGIIRGEPLTPIARKQREGWSEAFKSMKRRGEDKLVVDDSVDLEMKDWEW